MILDLETMFSNDQAVTATAASTNILNTGTPGMPWMASTALVRDIAIGNPVPLLVQVTTTFTAGGAATLTTALQMDTVEGFGSPTTIWQSSAVAVASLVAGYRIFDSILPRPEGGGALEQFLRLNYTVATGPMLTGNITAGVHCGSQTNV